MLFIVRRLLLTVLTIPTRVGEVEATQAACPQMTSESTMSPHRSGALVCRLSLKSMNSISHTPNPPSDVRPADRATGHPSHVPCHMSVNGRVPLHSIPISLQYNCVENLRDCFHFCSCPVVTFKWFLKRILCSVTGGGGI